MTDPTLILTADPDFSDLALAELQEAQPKATVLGALAPGVWLVTAVSFFSLAEMWRKAPPIFVRHICPVYFVVPLTEQEQVVAQIQDSVCQNMADWLDPTLPFSVQTRLFSEVPYKPFSVNTAVAQALSAKTGTPLNISSPTQVVSIVVGDNVAYVGVSMTKQNLSDWAGGARRFAREKGQISRSEFKLLEAFEQFQIPFPDEGTALDLGAAPGGWTRILRQKGFTVTAVDPAKLHASLQIDKKVHYQQLTADKFLDQQSVSYDIIVNDMRLDARESARLMVRFAGCLNQQGKALMTLKLPNKKRKSRVDEAFAILRHTYQIQGARQLFHNRSEITLFLERTQ